MLTKYEAKRLALKTNPDLDRLISVLYVEIKNKAQNGKFKLEYPFKKDSVKYYDTITEELKNAGFEVKTNPEKSGLLINWI